MTQASDRVRLHITPFNPDLYDRVVSASAKATATGVSYHSVQTQPEKGFGYIELPRMEAGKLKKKIHGFTLKGSKVRVEEAKPEKKRKADRDETEEERSERKKAKKEKKEKKEKKAKREEGVIEGYELEDGRHVKRGWSEGKDKKKKSKDQKMLFKTNVPPNSMPLEDDKKVKSKEKKAKKQVDKDGEKRSHRTPKVVEEFAKKKPVIISAESNSKAAAEYVEGKGWVDEDGVIVEAEPPSVKRQRAKERALKLAEETRLAEEERQQAEAMDLDTQKEEESMAEEEFDRDDASSEDVSDGASISEDDESEDDDDINEEAKETNPATGAQNHAQTEAEGVAPAPADDLATPVPESAREVHPLEALYKRAPNTATEDGSNHNLPPINTSFSFFNPEDIEDDDEEMASVPTHPPQTPHTKQDLEWRALRSAAPTPDTAGLGKRFRFAMEGVAQDEDEDSYEDADVDTADDGADATTSRDIANVDGKEESEFRKWFYEHRGENNRAWKKKRKEAKKQQRQRENRRLTRRVV